VAVDLAQLKSVLERDVLRDEVTAAYRRER
jgi:hypothetical protein